MDFQHPQILNLIDLAIAEDLGNGDHSSLASIPEGTLGTSRILCKEDGILAGIALSETIMHRIEAQIQLHIQITDGSEIKKGDIIATAEGPVHALLASERIVLNFMQRLSGIATRTHKAVQILKGAHTQILDTRKTTPGMRLLEKWAVKTGGGNNHRIGLYDMIMLKDNHVDSSGGIAKAVATTVEYLQSKHLALKIEVETRNISEVQQALDTGAVDRIMLDNFTPEACTEAVSLIAGRAETEASGGIHEENLLEYAASGVDYISLGYLTHSVKSLDISMKTRTNL
ncbi:MAG: carboxylating nicotinate-nucleotide diphosphorylase [Bacteroidetes bacterium]|nr:carboxylating nicotinate-nucleotide diphosphorylase [Bacteroidota bacterium]